MLKAQIQKKTRKKLGIGDYVPTLVRALDSERTILNLDSYSGRLTLLAFVGSVKLPETRKLVKTLSVIKHFFANSCVQFLGIGQGADGLSREFDSRLNIAFVDDPEFRISGAFGVMSIADILELRTSFTPLWMILDQNLRIVKVLPISSADVAFETFMTVVNDLTTRTAPPVLTHLRIFEEMLCEALIDEHTKNSVSLESNRNITIAPIVYNPLREAVLERLERRVMPELVKFSNCYPSRIQNLMIIRRKAGKGDVVSGRINSQLMQGMQPLFAVWIPLDDEVKLGGGVIFPEYSDSAVNPPVGSALVYSTSMLRKVAEVTEASRYYMECLLV